MGSLLIVSVVSTLRGAKPGYVESAESTSGGNLSGFDNNFTKTECLHNGRLRWNLQIAHLESKMIFQTSMIMFHANLQGCIRRGFSCQQLRFDTFPGCTNLRTKKH